MKFTISKQVFLDGLRQVASVVSSKTTLPILSNVKIEAENGQIRFTATDLDVCITGVVPANVLREGTVTLPAKKLVSIISELPEAEVQVDVNQRNQAAVECGRSQFKLNGLPADEFPEEQQLDAILPTKAVGELRRLLDEVGTVTIRFTRNQAAFEINDTLLISKLIDGNYPNYRQVIPTDCKESIELPCGELLETVRRVSLLSVDKSTNIKLNFRENELEVASSAEGVGEAHESMTITYSGRPLSISFNPDFFMAPLKTMAGDTVITLNLIDEMSPGVLKIGDEFLYVLMPMRSPN